MLDKKKLNLYRRLYHHSDKLSDKIVSMPWLNEYFESTLHDINLTLTMNKIRKLILFITYDNYSNSEYYKYDLELYKIFDKDINVFSKRERLILEYTIQTIMAENKYFQLRNKYTNKELLSVLVGEYKLQFSEADLIQNYYESRYKLH